MFITYPPVTRTRPHRPPQTRRSAALGAWHVKADELKGRLSKPVNRSAAERSLYEATRYAWKISKAKAKQAEVILATTQGLIVGAFTAHDWLEASAANFPGRLEFDGVPGRLGFVGEEAPDEIKRLYIGKRVPDEYRKRGAANPIKYTWGTAAAG